MKVITFGTFDLCHIGHINLLERCKYFRGIENEVIVGISSDTFSFEKKNKYPVYNEYDRKKIIKSIDFVDHVFLEKSFDEKRNYITENKADIFIIGDDWKGKFDYLCDVCEVVYLPRTENISTTSILNTIKS